MVSYCEFNLLIAIEIEHHFILLIIWIPSFGDCLFKSSVFPLGWVLFFSYNVFAILYISILWLQLQFFLFNLWHVFLFTLCYGNEQKFFMLVLLD